MSDGQEIPTEYPGRSRVVRFAHLQKEIKLLEIRAVRECEAGGKTNPDTIKEIRQLRRDRDAL